MIYISTLGFYYEKVIKIKTWLTRKILGADIYGIIVIDLHSKIKIFPSKKVIETWITRKILSKSTVYVFDIIVYISKLEFYYVKIKISIYLT